MGWRSYAASAGRAPRSSPPSSPFAQLECACGGSVRRAWTWWLTRPRGRAMSACRKSGSARPARRRRRWRCTGSSCCSTMLGRLARGLRRFPSWAPFPEQSSALRSFDVRSRGPARRTWRCLGRPRRRGLVAQATAHLLLRRRLPRCPKSEAGQRAAPRLPLLRPQQRVALPTLTLAQQLQLVAELRRLRRRGQRPQGAARESSRSRSRGEGEQARRREAEPRSEVRRPLLRPLLAPRLVRLVPQSQPRAPSRGSPSLLILDCRQRSRGWCDSRRPQSRWRRGSSSRPGRRLQHPACRTASATRCWRTSRHPLLTRYFPSSGQRQRCLRWSTLLELSATNWDSSSRWQLCTAAAWPSSCSGRWQPFWAPSMALRLLAQPALRRAPRTATARPAELPGCLACEGVAGSEGTCAAVRAATMPALDSYCSAQTQGGEGFCSVTDHSPAKLTHEACGTLTVGGLESR
mmetsp:Transcript_15184/g.57268  ORF Transcript_15184/g.57268 Transcript_15184/m.57268 type:complete len:463 (+) Transcript_15184:2748-4136(+)